ncbi:RagB/SusD family nutrient uptake outer membrane protein [Chitinophaga sp. CB10]|uniref:RagB/SusD family nutrient uptake outer membrane protein n=1 Tax=Chitinophaga sp. CB10 TaxID=1891659 RepID=UPI000B2847D6|nr:RagB/SusD family nutrient uptake outer membrane protein [Chitinophaga sp. CB10]
MKNYSYYISLLLLLAMLGCRKGEIPNLNNPTTGGIVINTSKSSLNNLVTGAESGMRRDITAYLDAVGIIGREIYRFSGSEPRYTTDLLGGGTKELDNNTFYLTNPWAGRYLVIRQCMILLQAASGSKVITDAERKGYTGFAKTIIGYQLLLNLNMTNTNGIRIPNGDPTYIGPVITDVAQARDTILKFLQEGADDLAAGSVIFPLSEGFAGFTDAAGLRRFNRAIAARVLIYSQKWANALAALNESFFDLNGPLSRGVNHYYSTGGGDLSNPLFIALGATGDVRVVHPAYVTDILPGDTRISKAVLRSSAASQSGLSSNRDLWIWKSLNDPVNIIRNEELILIYAEAKAQLNAIPDAIVAINRIRTFYGLPPYAGAVTQAALINEILYQRRYSLLGEGHRWVDLRRYGRLGSLPKDRPDDDVWTQFPLPQNEVNI